MDGEDLSVKEVAELTGWSQANIKVKAFRARRRMRKLLEDLLGKSRSNKLDLKKGATDR
jgi:RNA polymerase sigma-70 factor (ECF subfamily)